jgi:hypothetical protein
MGILRADWEQNLDVLLIESGIFGNAKRFPVASKADPVAVVKMKSLRFIIVCQFKMVNLYIAVPCTFQSKAISSSTNIFGTLYLRTCINSID